MKSNDKNRALEFFQGFGILLCGVSIILSCLLFIVSFPGVGFGIASQTEPPAAALHFLSILSAFGLSVIYLSGRRSPVRQACIHPYVLLPLILCCISFVFLPLHALQVRAVLGAPQTGEGIASWLSICILIAATRLIWNFTFWKRALQAFITITILIIYALCLYNKATGFPYAPYYFTDFLAISLFALIPILWRDLKKIAACFQNQKHRMFFWLTVYLIFLSLIYFTGNNIAIAFVCIGIPVLVLLSWLKNQTLGKKLQSIYLSLIPAAALAVYGFISLFFNTQGYYPLMHFKVVNTLASRSFLIDTAVQDNFISLSAFLFGTGWGTFTEHLTRHMPLEWLNLNIERGAQWDGITTDHFHSHNMFAETFMAAGIFGFIIIYVFVISIPWFAKKSEYFSSLLFAGGFAAVASLWFFFPLNLPHIAMALAACSSRTSRMAHYISAKNFKSAAIIFLPLTVLILGYASVSIFKTALSTMPYEPEARLGAAVTPYCTGPFEDGGAGGLHLAQLMTQSVRGLLFELSEDSNSLSEQDIKKSIGISNTLFCQSGQYMKDHRNISNRLHIARLIMRGEILIGLSRYLDPQTRSLYESGWTEELQTWLRRIPSRPDMAVTYLSLTLEQGREDDIVAITQQLLAHNPDDPVGLWFEGIVLTGQPQHAQTGIASMRRALTMGIERLLPVDANLKAQLTAQ